MMSEIEAEGFLERVSDGIAFFTLTAPDGKKWWGEGFAEDFTEKDIRERRRFLIVGDELVKVPDKEIDEESIDKMLTELLGED